MSYAIDDLYSTQLAAGFRTEDEAFARAEQLANQLSAPVLVYGVGEDASDLGATRVEPQAD